MLGLCGEKYTKGEILSGHRKNLELGARRPGVNPGCHSVALWLGVNYLTTMSLSCLFVKLREIRLYDFSKFYQVLPLDKRF